MQRHFTTPAVFAFLAFAFLAFAFVLATSPTVRAEPESGLDETVMIQRGEQIYRQACASCHGDAGQGVEDYYADPLAGDLTIGGLTEVIADTMPEEDPDSCVAEEATAVATYIHEAFYSEAARLRNRPPRITLARLTGEQLRQSLADLYGHFHQPPWTKDERGVQAIYFTGTRWRNDKKKIERVDPVIDFDFGEAGPGEGINAKDFYIHWTGSLKVDRTGRYEIILRSSCSCTMDFGNNDRELINNHVQSAGKEEFRRTLHLTAGRAYPFTIDFFQRERKTEQPPAKISLSWVPPGGVEEIVPPRHLIPDHLPPTFSVQAKLPPDDRSYGYERGTEISRQWDQSTTDAALEFAQIAIDELYPRYRQQHRKESDENRNRLRGFLGELVETAFRGPLDDATRSLYVDKYVDATEDDGEAIKSVVLLALKSPRFLYPTLDATQTASQPVANRLALVMFDSLPSDEWLIKAARQDQMKSEQQISEAAGRMINDYRARAKTRAFLHEWLGIAESEEITKDGEAFPGFDAALVSDLEKSLDAFLDEVVASEASDFRQLLQADWAFTTQRIEAYYGPAWKPTGDPPASETTNVLRRTISDREIHVGVLTHPLLMSRLAYHSTSSPIHRGIFLIRHALGRVLRPPNAAFTPLNPDLHPDLTTRQRVNLQTGEVNCQVCHEKINSLGFALEGFDATGRFRSTENDKPIDASGSYVTLDGETVEFNGARELADFLAGSEDCQRAFVEAAFEHFVKQPVAAYGPETSDRLTKSFQDSGFNIRQLIVSIAVIAVQPPTNMQTNT